MIRRCRRLLFSPLFHCLFAGLILLQLNTGRQQQPPTLHISEAQLTKLKNQLTEQTGAELDQALWQKSIEPADLRRSAATGSAQPEP